MPVFLTHTVPPSRRSSRPAEIASLAQVIPLRSWTQSIAQLLAPHRVKAPRVILLLALISSREPGWICGLTGVLAHLPRQHKIRGSLCHVHLEGDFCSCLMTGASISCVICTSKSRATGTFRGLMLRRWGWGLPLRAPSLYSLVLHTVRTASPCPCWPVPTDGTGTTQLPLPTGVPVHWGCSPATAALGCLVSVPHASSLFPLLTSLRQAAALQFCPSSTGEASEQTCKSSPRRLLLHLALSSGRRYPMNRSGKAKGAQRVLSSGFEQAAAHSWIWLKILTMEQKHHCNETAGFTIKISQISSTAKCVPTIQRRQSSQHQLGAGSFPSMSYLPPA